MRHPLNLHDRLYFILFYLRRLFRYDLPENRVGWRSRQNQEIRFQALTGIGDLSGARILDWGCGLGCLYGFLKNKGWNGEYTGIDILGFMVRGARRRFPGIAFEKRDILRHPPVRKWDYILISGVFNHKVTDNWDWMEKTVEAIYPLAEKGLAFNVLNQEREWEWRDTDLFYADPRALEERAAKWSGGRYKLVRDYLSEDLTVYLYH